MFDLETLGVSPRSTILSIGAVTFHSNGLGAREFYIECNPVQPGRSIEISTLGWWFKQAQENKIYPPLSGNNRIDLAVYAFFKWMRSEAEWYSPGTETEIILWANGIDFDWGLIKEVLADTEMTSIIKYNNVRDYRTLYKLLSHVPRPEMSPDLQHNALEDAKHQALHCIDLLREVGYW
jgi:hypothetical protein